MRAAALRYRLKRSVEVFPASDGTIYLLRLGAGDDLMLPEPSAPDRALLGVLADGFKSRNELQRAAGLTAAELDASLEPLAQAGVLERRREPRLLHGEQAERYDRQLHYLADIAPAPVEADELQLRLADASVVILGCGGLGSWAASTLAGAGVGRLVLIDDDRVELSNLARQLLFAQAQIGELKVLAARDSLRAHNPGVDVVPVVRRVRAPEDLSDVLADAPSLLISTGDWPPHALPRWVNSACLEAGVPWIGAGQFPPRLRVGPMVLPGRSACLECLERASEADYPQYKAIAAWRDRRATTDPSTGPASGVIGALLASEAMNLLLGVIEPASVGAAVLFDLHSLTATRETFAKRDDCTSCSPLAATTHQRRDH